MLLLLSFSIGLLVLALILKLTGIGSKREYEGKSNENIDIVKKGLMRCFAGESVIVVEKYKPTNLVVTPIGNGLAVDVSDKIKMDGYFFISTKGIVLIYVLEIKSGILKYIETEKNQDMIYYDSLIYKVENPFSLTDGFVFSFKKTFPLYESIPFTKAFVYINSEKEHNCHGENFFRDLKLIQKEISSLPSVVNVETILELKKKGWRINYASL